MKMSPPQFLRAILALIIAPPLTFIVSSLALIDLFFLRRSQSKAQIFPRIWGRMICKIAGAKVNVEGLENISGKQTYIFVANHASQFDIFSFQGYFPHDFRWVAKKELFHIPVFGQAMHKSGFVSIDRSKSRKAMTSLIKAAERISTGTSVLLFPEGTRSPDGKLHQFKTGAILIAIKAGVPVVPIGFKGTYDILPKGKLLARSGVITIKIGPPVETKNYQPKDKQLLAKQLHDTVLELLKESQA